MQKKGKDSAGLVVPPMKRKYRDAVHTLYDVLTVCETGAIISQVARRANITCFYASPIIKKLLKIGYLSSKPTGRHVKAGPVIVYTTTEKGKAFRNAIEEFSLA